jgi:hypothetical protein
VVLLMTPLGILASGAAWGEWAAKDFSNSATRAQMAAASGRAAPPMAVPSGLARWANLWTAPLPDYAPHFVKSAAFGYLLSAMFGVGLILMVTWLLQRATRGANQHGANQSVEECAELTSRQTILPPLTPGRSVNREADQSATPPASQQSEP